MTSQKRKQHELLLHGAAERRAAVSVPNAGGAALPPCSGALAHATATARVRMSEGRGGNLPGSRMSAKTVPDYLTLMPKMWTP
jgi:hypothetical protein